MSLFCCNGILLLRSFASLATQPNATPRRVDFLSFTASCTFWNLDPSHSDACLTFVLHLCCFGICRQLVRRGATEHTSADTQANAKLIRKAVRVCDFSAPCPRPYCMPWTWGGEKEGKRRGCSRWCVVGVTIFRCCSWWAKVGSPAYCVTAPFLFSFMSSKLASRLTTST